MDRIYGLVSCFRQPVYSLPCRSSHYREMQRHLQMGGVHHTEMSICIFYARRRPALSSISLSIHPRPSGNETQAPVRIDTQTKHPRYAPSTHRLSTCSPLRFIPINALLMQNAPFRSPIVSSCCACKPKWYIQTVGEANLGQSRATRGAAL